MTDAPRIVDLSHPLEPGMPSYPGLPTPEFNVFRAHGNPEDQKSYAPGTTFEIASYAIGGNTGTYVDAPYHRDASGADFLALDLARLVDLPGLLVRAPADGVISAGTLAGLPLRGRAVLLHTGWSRLWGGSGYFHSGPFLGVEAAGFLAQEGAVLVGIDCANIDDMKDKARPAHTTLLRAGIPIVEHLRGLDCLEGRDFRFFAAPPAIRRGTSFPVRAFALCGPGGPQRR
jgi:kynurenine formamidase